MPEFVRDGQADKRWHVGFGLIRQPGDAVGVNRGKRPSAGSRINERVA